MFRSKLFAIASLVVAAAMALSACGAATPTTTGETQAPPAQATQPSATKPSATTAPEAQPTEAGTAQSYTLPTFPEPADVTGDIISAGSSTVFPLSERMAELFQQEGYTGNITVDSIGSGAGFERFCKTGETDISNASRHIKKEEVEACNAIGRNPIEFRVGTDALAVVVSAENTFVDALTLKELALVFSTAQTWADVRAGWPAEPIQRFSPGTDSGTFDYFVEVVMAPANPVDGKANVEAGEKAILESAGAQFSEDDNVLAQGVEGSPYAVGYFGYAYYAAEAGTLRAVPIAKGDDPAAAIEPSQESVDAATYPLARPLFIYSDAQIMADKPQVGAFIYFYLNNLADNIVDVGYFPAPESEIAKSYGRLTSAVGVEVDPSGATGDIISAGSSTVFPLSERMAELFQQEGYTGNITVDSIGSGAGFERFCKTGETDISNASRHIKKEEVEACNAIGRNPIEFRVGTDALAVVVSAENTFVDALTLKELALVFSTAQTWADVRAGWPAEPIQRFSPGTDSGTFDYFVEVVMAPANPVDGKANVEAGEKAILESAGAQFSEDDNVLAQGVEGSPYAVGYFGYAYYAAEAGTLRAIPIAKEDDPTKAIAPELATVNAATYPLARPLFIYSDAGIMAEKPQVAAFILFYLTHVNDEILDVGYFPATDNAVGDALSNWLSALGVNMTGQ
jgi:phosphate binding protein